MGCDLTVLMAVRNGGSYLRTAIDSILNQTYPNFHFLIVDDASTDGTPDVINSYGDSRIQLVCLDENVGQTEALNVGLRQASTRWIARMDADDYSAPTRFEEQMRALDSEPSLTCLGTFAWTFRDDPRVAEGEVRTHTSHGDIMRALIGGSPLIHGTIIVDREALLEVGAYNGAYRYSADVDMYDRLLVKHQAATLPQPLLGIRRHDQQGSRTRVAFDEIIEIFNRRLSSGAYSSQDSGTIKASLSRLYLFRARKWGGEGEFFRTLSDLFSAFKTSPMAFPLNTFKVFVVDFIPERRRAALKRLLVRVPGFLKS